MLGELKISFCTEYFLGKIEISIYWREKVRQFLKISVKSFCTRFRDDFRHSN